MKTKRTMKHYGRFKREASLMNCQSKKKYLIKYSISNKDNQNSCLENEKRIFNSQKEYFVNDKVQNEIEKNNVTFQNTLGSNLKVKLDIKKAQKEKNFQPFINHKKRKEKSIIKKANQIDIKKTNTSNWSYDRNDYIFYGVNKKNQKKIKNFIIRIPMGKL